MSNEEKESYTSTNLFLLPVDSEFDTISSPVKDETFERLSLIWKRIPNKKVKLQSSSIRILSTSVSQEILNTSLDKFASRYLNAETNQVCVWILSRDIEDSVKACNAAVVRTDKKKKQPLQAALCDITNKMNVGNSSYGKYRQRNNEIGFNQM